MHNNILLYVVTNQSQVTTCSHFLCPPVAYMSLLDHVLYNFPCWKAVPSWQLLSAHLIMDKFLTTCPLIVTYLLVPFLTGSLASALDRTRWCLLFFPCPSHSLIFSSIDPWQHDKRCSDTKTVSSLVLLIGCIPAHVNVTLWTLYGPWNVLSNFNIGSTFNITRSSTSILDSFTCLSYWSFCDLWAFLILCHTTCLICFITWKSSLLYSDSTVSDFTPGV